MLQAEAPPGALAAELEEGADFHYIVHQAAGMVAAQLDFSVGQALVRLRAYAFANDRSLSEVAKDVVERTLVSVPITVARPPGREAGGAGAAATPGRNPRNIGRLGRLPGPGGPRWPVP